MFSTTCFVGCPPLLVVILITLTALPFFDVPPTLPRPRVRKNVSKLSTDKSRGEQDTTHSTSLPHNPRSNDLFPRPRSNRKRKLSPPPQAQRNARYDVWQTSNTNQMPNPQYSSE